MRFEEVADAVLAGWAGQVGEAQLCPFRVEGFADRPSDAPLVGHTHYQADLTVNMPIVDQRFA